MNSQAEVLKSKFISPQNMVNFGLLVFVFFSPFSIAGTQIGLSIALLGWVWRVIANRNFNWEHSFFELPVLVYLSAFVISIIFSQNRLKSLISLGDEWLLVIPFLLINNLKDEGFIKKLVNLIFLISGIVAIYAIWQHYTGIDLLRNQHIDPSFILPYKKYRSIAFFDLPLTYGFYAMLMGILSFCLGSWEKRTSWKIFYFTVATLTITANFFTYTRSTLYAQIFAFIIYFIFFKSRNKTREILAVAGYLVLIYLIDPQILGRSLIAVQAGSFEQADIRSVIWSTSFNIFKDHPLFGIGFGNFPIFYQRYLKVPSEIFGHAHNDFLNVAVNAGIVGFLAFIFMWVVFLKNILRRYKEKKESYSKALILGGVLSVIAFLLASQFQCYYTAAIDNMILFFVMGLSESVARISSGDS
ncbi:MAG: O-antigen ligase family protein [candidate division Zixibacteria bacterium]|nr:O-antigen ligase family protein [candidate division Zixibacteria bacterium]